MPTKSGGSADTQPTNDRLDPALLRIAGSVLLGAVAALLDTTVVSVALDQLGEALSAPVSTVQWVSTAYLLAMALVILARVAGSQRFGRVMALAAVPGNLIPIVGPVLGGLLLDGLSWRWIFLINVPVCVPALMLAWRALPADPVDSGRHPLDVLGIALLSPAVLALVYGLAQAGEQSSFVTAGTTGPVAIGLGLLAALSVHALRAKAPIIDLRLFRFRSFRASAMLMLLTGAALYGPMLLRSFGSVGSSV